MATTAVEVFEEAAAGESPATTVVAATAHLLGMAASAVVAVVDPQVLVLGGSLGGRPELATRVAAVLGSLAPRPVEVRTSILGSRAGVVGALSVALRRLHEEFFGGSELATALPLRLPPPRAA